MHPGTHDLVIEDGYSRATSRLRDVHQDGIQAMGGQRVTFSSFEVDCDGVNAAMFINMGGGDQERPTDVVCDGCVLKKAAPPTTACCGFSDSVRSGARNSTIIWCGTVPSAAAASAVYITDGASEPGQREQQDRAPSGGTAAAARRLRQRRR